MQTITTLFRAGQSKVCFVHEIAVQKQSFIQRKINTEKNTEFDFDDWRLGCVWFSVTEIWGECFLSLMFRGRGTFSNFTRTCHVFLNVTCFSKACNCNGLTEVAVFFTRTCRVFLVYYQILLVLAMYF